MHDTDPQVLSRGIVRTQRYVEFLIEHLTSAKEEIWQDLDDWKTLPSETTGALDEALVRVLKALNAEPKEGSSERQPY